jgi:hypothetical protein
VIWRIAQLGAVVALLAIPRAPAHADPYYFAKGSIVHNGCSTAERAWLAEWTSFGTLDLAAERDLITLKGITHAAEGGAKFWPYAYYELAPKFAMITRIDAADCADIRCTSLRATVRLINEGDGEHRCFVEWRGVIARDLNR